MKQRILALILAGLVALTAAMPAVTLAKGKPDKVNGCPNPGVGCEMRVGGPQHPGHGH